MERAGLSLTLVLTAVLAVSLAAVAVVSPSSARRAVVAILADASPGSWMDQLRSRITL